MFASMFNPENGFWQVFGKIADVMMLSLLWIFCSLPVVTMGPATAALYDATVKCVRGEEKGTLSRYFRTFRRELATASLVTLIWVPIIVGLRFGMMALWPALTAALGSALTVTLYFVVMLLPLGGFCWMFPLLSRFTFNVPGLCRMGVRFSLAHLPATLAIVVLTIAAVEVCVLTINSMFFIIYLLTLPCLLVLLWSLMMERAFRKYMPEEQTADEEE